MLTWTIFPKPLTGTGAGTVPQMTPFAPAQVKVYVSLFIPVFDTQKIALYPPVFASRCGCAPPSGVTDTSYACRTLTVYVPVPWPGMPLTVIVILPAPVVAAVPKLMFQFLLVP